MGVTAAWMAVAAVVGYVASSQINAPKTPPLEGAVQPPKEQGEKAPDAGAVRAQQTGTGQAGGSPGVAQTFLTGSGGIDPSLLQLGKSTLLGGGTPVSTGGG